MRDEKNSPAYFPRTYLTDLFQFIRNNSDRVQCITYKDFCWGNDFSHEDGYRSEWQDWQHRLTDGRIDRNKIYLVIQYDVDTAPERTMDLLRDPHHDGIPANIMIFVRRLDRRFLVQTKELQYTDYVLDEELLRKRQDSGSVIGYHFNAYERSGWNAGRAQEIFAEDVASLRKRFDISFCSAHGGVPDAEGRNNNSVKIPDALRTSLRWVHNKYSPRFNGQFSDGGHQNSKLNPSQRDIRDFVASWRPGGRYRLLVHPQYYDPEFVASPSYSGTPWYDDLVRAVRSTQQITDPKLYALSPLQSPVRGVLARRPQPLPHDSGIAVQQSGLRALSTKVFRRVHALFGGMQHRGVELADAGFDGQVLIDTSVQPEILGNAASKFGVKQGAYAGNLLYPQVGRAGYLLLGGGQWQGSEFPNAGYMLSTAFWAKHKLQFLPWGGWVTSNASRFSLDIETAGLPPPFELRTICLSYDKAGHLIAKRDIGSLSARRSSISEQFKPAAGAAGFNIALFKAKELPGGVVTLTSVKLVRHVSA